MTKKSALILEEIARRREQEQVVGVEAERVKMVVFSLRGDLYAVRGANVKEILPLLPVHPVPGTPELLPGVINVRGRIESVVDLTKLIGLPGSGGGPFGRILIGDAGGIRSGILVDAVVDVLDVPLADLRPPLDTLPKSIKDFVAGGFQHGDVQVTLLDLARVFGQVSA